MFYRPNSNAPRQARPQARSGDAQLPATKTTPVEDDRVRSQSGKDREPLRTDEQPPSAGVSWELAQALSRGDDKTFFRLLGNLLPTPKQQNQEDDFTGWDKVLPRKL